MVDKKIILFALPNFAFLLTVGFPSTGLVSFFSSELLLPQLEPLRYLLNGLGMINGAIMGPLIGYLSDRTKTRLGRRLPWIIIFSPMVALMFWLLILPAFFKSILGAFAIPFISIYMITVYWTYITLYNCAYTPYIGIMADLANPEERTEYSTFFNLIGIGGTILSLFLFGILYSIFGTFIVVNTVYVIIMLAFIFLMVMGFRKDERLLHPPPITKNKISYKRIFSKKEFLIFEAAQCAWTFSFMIILS
ncbi:MAG: MFS transporter, partial [Candidatus Helarchaeales archaeon]